MIIPEEGSAETNARQLLDENGLFGPYQGHFRILGWQLSLVGETAEANVSLGYAECLGRLQLDRLLPAAPAGPDAYGVEGHC